MEKKTREDPWKTLAIILFIFAILVGFAVAEKVTSPTTKYNIQGFEISKQDLDSLQDNAIKDNLGRFQLCSISQDRCIVVGKID